VQYAAKLLFQYRVVTNGSSNRRRQCEERIVVFGARSAKAAVAKAKSVGARAQHKYKNDSGGLVNFEFVGILDLMSLGPECDKGEVWYEIRERLEPKERAKQILPAERDLNALKWERRLTTRSSGP
jgi:hypothetical protein